MLFLLKKFTVGRGILRQCVVMMQQLVVLLPEFKTKPSHTYTQLP
jgi:hypothetical protein